MAKTTQIEQHMKETTQMKKLFLIPALAATLLTTPATANPILLALNEQPNCLEEVENSDALQIKRYKKVGSDGVRITIKKNKKTNPSNADFKAAQADFKACMKHRLEAHSVELK